TIRAYAKGKAVNTTPTITEESKKLLFGQGAARIAA
ncbi:MAG: thiol:disulfide oxidoreductase, partial [Proteobacteria bacterium]|nr:thiol:disulfide oxidoreductase [Pseudomonadota bacterium]